MKLRNILFVAAIMCVFSNNMKVYADDIDADRLTAGVAAVLSECKYDNLDIELNEKDIVEEAYDEPQIEYVEVESTAYYGDPLGADGTILRPGHLAGMREWMGKTIDLYDDGYNYMGEYTFHDVGYGQSTGWGGSSLLRGKSVGTIEDGECIDIYMNTYSECIKYGRRTVYMVWKE